MKYQVHDDHPFFLTDTKSVTLSVFTNFLKVTLYNMKFSLQISKCFQAITEESYLSSCMKSNLFQRLPGSWS